MAISSQSPGDLQSFWDKSEPGTNLSCSGDGTLECPKVDAIRPNTVSPVLLAQMLHLRIPSGCLRGKPHTYS